ncbi:MAG: hypothetical protein U9O53_00230 [archaeon]|nr:hypothetical protein [archaeon]
MVYFEPFFNDVKIITSDTGRYRLQLEIPGCSTLSENDIDRILKISSWEYDSNKSVDGYEERRSAVLARENSIEKGGIRLEFFPPNNTNFMDFFPARQRCRQAMQKEMRLLSQDRITGRWVPILFLS